MTLVHFLLLPALVVVAVAAVVYVWALVNIFIEMKRGCDDHF